MNLIPCLVSVMVIVMVNIPIFGIANNVLIESDLFSIDALNELVEVSGNINIRKEGISITGNKARYTKSKDVIHITQDVMLTKEGLSIRCNELLAKWGEKMIVLSGTIQFEYKDFQGQSGQAYIDLDKNLISLTGSPEIRQFKDRIVGENIQFYMDDLRIVTTGKAKIRLSEEKFRL